MKIAIFSDNFYPEISGIADSIISLAKELDKRGYKIDFYVPWYSLKNYKKINAIKKEVNTSENINVIRFLSLPFPAGTQQARLVIPSFWRWLYIWKNRPDIIFSQLVFGVGLEGLISSKILNIPMVGTNHTAITEFVKYSPLKARWFSNFMLRYISWYYNHCRFVTGPSQSILTEMEENGLKSPHKVVSNPIDTEDFSPINEDSAQKLKKRFNFSDNTLIFAGRLAIEKDIDVLIRAIILVKKEIPEISLALAGHGQDEMRLKKLAKDLDVEDNVNFLGTLNKPTLAKAFQASEIFVTASTSETQGMTILQAMACGKPVIGVRARALPEYINCDNNGILVNPGEHQALAKNIIILLNNKEKRVKLGKEGRKTAENFSASNIASVWENIFKQQLKKS